jgi:hypothetical protein
MVRLMAPAPTPWNDLDADQRDYAILRQLGAGRSLAALADDLDVSIHELAAHCEGPRFEALATHALERQKGLAKLSARFLTVSTVTAASAGKGGLVPAADLDALRKLSESLDPVNREIADDETMSAAIKVIEAERWKLVREPKG